MGGQQSNEKNAPPWEDVTDTINVLFFAAYASRRTWSERRELFFKLVKGFYRYDTRRRTLVDLEKWNQQLENKFQNLHRDHPFMKAQKRAAKRAKYRALSERFSREMTEWARKPGLQSPRRESMIKRLMGASYFMPEPRGRPPWTSAPPGLSDPNNVPMTDAKPSRSRNPWTRYRIWSNQRIQIRWDQPRWYNLNTRIWRWRVDRASARIEAETRIRYLLASPDLVPERVRPFFVPNQTS